ncbi:hypothetical protein HPB52_000524 [Rhipicephalus sanguineus]|uniref:Tick transposon n=1 Tax=Rhipicephalus sanguineus TaxID=34632 RepID=A0A9D4QA79_RHISA|nr:hypothetical protein HPB52_000524 [Rhipicephalus sanguineus]
MARTAERLHQLTGTGDPLCSHCAIPETLEHILLQCAQYAEDCRVLVRAYRDQGLAATSVDELLFPRAHSTAVGRAMRSLIVFFTSCALSGRLLQRRTPWKQPLRGSSVITM